MGERERERTHLLGIWDGAISPSVRKRERKKRRGSKCERDMACLRYTNWVQYQPKILLLTSQYTVLITSAQGLCNITTSVYWWWNHSVQAGGLHSNLPALLSRKSKLFMCAARSLNQTAQCELMAWKNWEKSAHRDPYIETDAGPEYKVGRRDEGMLNVCRVLRGPQPWKWLGEEKYFAFINLGEIHSNIELWWMSSKGTER